jgi:hypothetical protein
MIKLHWISSYRGETDYRVSGGPMDGQTISIRSSTAAHHERWFGQPTNASEARFLKHELELCGTVTSHSGKPIHPEVALAAQAEQEDRRRRLAHLMEPGAFMEALDVAVFDPKTRKTRRVPLKDYCEQFKEMAA